MSSKWFLLRLALAISLITGCGLQIGEEPADPVIPSHSGGGLNCVGQIPETVSRYVEAEISDGEITAFVRCLQDAFTSFARLTRGKDHRIYTPDEIRSFLQKYFIKDREISDELLNELMFAKTVLVGGEIDRIHRKELYMAAEILEDVRLEAIRLRPHLRVLNPHLAKNDSAENIGAGLRAADRALNQTIQVLVGRLSGSLKSYQLSRIENLLNEFRKFTKWEDHFPDSHPVEVWMNFIRVVKELTLEENDPQQFRVLDWGPLLKYVTKWYLVYVEYDIGVRGQPLHYGVGLRNVMHLVDTAITLVKESMSKQPTSSITFAQIDSLIKSLLELKVIPGNWSQEVVSNAVRSVLTRMFGNPDTKPNDRESSSLDTPTLARIQEHFARWAKVQEYLEFEYRDQLPSGPAFDVPSIQSNAIIRPAEALLKKVGSSSDWKEFLAIKSKLTPLFPGGGDQVRLVAQNGQPYRGLNHDFHNLSYMNVMRSIVAMIFHGYADSSHGRADWNAGLTKVEAENFYNDFREFGITLGIFDRRQAAAGARAWSEGNLFTSSADGLTFEDDSFKGYLSMVEAIELLGYLYSGGKMSHRMYGKLYSRCRFRNQSQPVDSVYGKLMLDRACVQRHMADVLLSELDSMPDLKKYIQSLSPDEQSAFVADLLDTARTPNPDEDPQAEKLISSFVEQSELSTISVVVHYLESLMTRYDVDGNGVLTTHELEGAAGVFTGFIKDFRMKTECTAGYDFVARAAFYYILAYKEVPEGFGKYWTVPRIALVWRPSLSMDRKELGQVFKLIITKLISTKKKGGATCQDLEPVD